MRILEQIQQIQRDVDEFVSKHAWADDDLIPVLEVRDVHPPGGLDSYAVPFEILAGEGWARMKAVPKNDQPEAGWAWYEPTGKWPEPMTHQADGGEQWRKIAGLGVE